VPPSGWGRTSVRTSGTPKSAAIVAAIGWNLVVVTTTAGRPAFSNEMASKTLYAVQLPQSAAPVTTTSAASSTRWNTSSAQGMAALAERPPGPFLTTSETVAPVRVASVSAARVMTVAAFGLPLSSTATRRPASVAGEVVSALRSGRASLSGA
jgi:hypothetical protein